MRTETKNRWLSILIAVSVILGIIAIYQYNRTINYQRQIEAQFEKSFNDAVDYVKDVNVLLTKTMVVSSTPQFSRLSTEIFRKSSLAKSNLDQLPTSNVSLDNISKFLSQVGDYTYFLTQKLINNGVLSDEEKDQLAALSKYSDTFYNDLLNIQNDLYSGKIRIGGFDRVEQDEGSKDSESNIIANLSTVEKDFQEYPSLIYDGPFSSHIEKMEPLALKDKVEVNSEQAIDVAKTFLGGKDITDVVITGESEGKVPTYDISAKSKANKKENDIFLQVTKVNGMVLNMSINREIGSATMDAQAAIKKAKDFLGSMGFYNMKESYYDLSDSSGIINFSYVDQDNVIIYPELIKVKIALDNGEVIGFESLGYIYSHDINRKLPSPKLSMAEARKMVNKNLNIQGEHLALIPLESKREVLCYEFKGSYKDLHFIVYINAQTGKEEDVLLLIESENGILTM